MAGSTGVCTSYMRPSSSVHSPAPVLFLCCQLALLVVSVECRRMVVTLRERCVAEGRGAAEG